MYLCCSQDKFFPALAGSAFFIKGNRAYSVEFFFAVVEEKGYQQSFLAEE